MQKKIQDMQKTTNLTLNIIKKNKIDRVIQKNI
jgi:hypothetical protein